MVATVSIPSIWIDDVVEYTTITTVTSTCTGTINKNDDIYSEEGWIYLDISSGHVIMDEPEEEAEPYKAPLNKKKICVPKRHGRQGLKIHKPFGGYGLGRF